MGTWSIWLKKTEAAISRNLTLPRKYFRKKYRWHLKIQLSRDELSSMIGTATESCIRSYQTLKSGFIDLIGKKNNIERLGQTKKKLAD
jgi:hypothetical protein